MSVQYPGLGAYDTVERKTHRHATEGYEGYTPHTQRTPEQARSGVISGQILAVLVGSTTLALIGLCVVLAVVV